MYLGIDGCKAGWIVASIDKSATLKFQLIEDLNALHQFKSPEYIWIDMPISFATKGYRSCELEARKLLANRRSSIFFTPCKEAVFSKSFEEACAVNYERCGKKISIQAWNICNKIKEVNSFVSGNQHIRISESHPELCFYGLNNNTPCQHNKKTVEGKEERLQIIGRISKHYAQVICQTNIKGSSKDDVVDAAVMAIAAWSNQYDYVPKNAINNEGGSIVFAQL